jgi:hypothetical protein
MLAGRGGLKKEEEFYFFFFEINRDFCNLLQSLPA